MRRAQSPGWGHLQRPGSERDLPPGGLGSEALTQALRQMPYRCVRFPAANFHPLLSRHLSLSPLLRDVLDDTTRVRRAACQ